MMEEGENQQDLNQDLSEVSGPVDVTMPVQKQLFVLAGVLGVMFTLGGAMMYLSNDGLKEPDNQVATPAVIATDAKNDEAMTLSELQLVAESAFAIDVDSGRVFYEKKADQKRPLASITKLMTALVAKEIIEEGELVPITAAAVDQAGESGLSVGERFSYQKLSDLVLLSSSNDGAYALGAAAGMALNPSSPEDAFVKAMNVRARELGLDATTFRNPTGLDISEDEAGAYGSAEDVAKLMSYILLNYPELLEETSKPLSTIQSQSGESHEANNTNLVIEEITQVIGSKTGYTTLAGGNLAVAFDAGLNRPVVAVVLGSSYQGRFSDMVKLVEAIKHEINSEN